MKVPFIRNNNKRLKKERFNVDRNRQKYRLYGHSNDQNKKNNNSKRKRTIVRQQQYVNSNS